METRVLGFVEKPDLPTAERYGRHFAVMFIDLDRFKWKHLKRESRLRLWNWA